MEIRWLEGGDVDACVGLNNASIPAVSEIDVAGLQRLVDQSAASLVVVDDDPHHGRQDDVVGFCIVLGPGVDYGSVNYRWFSERYDDFAYLDRIVVADHYRNNGAGAALYGEVERRLAAVAPWLLCEVNLRPRNDGSLRFHARLGFTEVGQQDTNYGITVSMLAKPLAPTTAR
ncbi:MAG TPA: GNAT family N-acetyltransferase [Ilumatobacteraceae bacterium]|nr:GNAT family N-acetyltransferase [Ilumatobacteraceae bacterium]